MEKTMVNRGEKAHGCLDFLYFPCILETENAAAEIAKDRAFLCMGYYCASSRKLNPSAGCVKKKISLHQ